MASAATMKYSQGDEQKHILAAVGDTPGRFLDIGAWNAKHLSNTRALFEAGWGGVLVEPSPEPFLGILKEYGNEPNVSLICAAVGFERSLVKFHATADALTTSDESSFQKWKGVGGFYGSFYAPMITIPEILAQFGGFGFVSIDTEGTSVDLFKALMATGMDPACVCVEHDNRIVECCDIAAAAGYRQLYLSGENAVYGR